MNPVNVGVRGLFEARSPIMDLPKTATAVREWRECLSNFPLRVFDKATGGRDKKPRRDEDNEKVGQRKSIYSACAARGSADGIE
jgi:hypothetical protein